MAAERRQSVVFIDLDRTLLEGPFPPLVFPRILGEIARKTGMSIEGLEKLAREENRARMADPTCPAVRAMDWDDIFTQLAGRFGVQLPFSALDIVRAHPGSPFSSLHPGAMEALKMLAAARPRRALVLATKGLGKYQLPVIEALGLRPYFDAILTPEVNQALKNSPDFYKPWPELTRLQIMVGDTYEDDVVPAQRFGFRTVWKIDKPLDYPVSVDPFARPKELLNGDPRRAVRPDAIIFSLFELPEVINRIEDEALQD